MTKWQDKRRAEYGAKLRDPRWQKMRLEVMQRDAFTCQDCGDATRTLNVHHKFYRPAADPWDYPVASLVTLCEDCHEERTESTNETKEAERELVELMRTADLDPRDVVCLVQLTIKRQSSPIDIAYFLHSIGPSKNASDVIFALTQAVKDKSLVTWLLSQYPYPRRGLE